MAHEKVLIVDDDTEFRSGLEDLVNEWGYEVVGANHGLDAWQLLLGEDGPRLTLIDWRMPGIDGVQLCRMIRKQSKEDYIYIILISVKDQNDEIVQGLFAGADDYITKPFFPQELKARIMGGSRILRMQRRLIRMREELRLRAASDPLTGIWNRAGILEILDNELNRSGRERRSLGLIMLDIDHFKKVNDTYGHVAGDVVLKKAVRCMQMAVRSYDALGRYGGDEFLVVVPGCNLEETAILAERIRLRLESMNSGMEEDPLAVTASLGVAAKESMMAPKSSTLIALADRALGRAKRRSRNSIELAGQLPKSMIS